MKTRIDKLNHSSTKLEKALKQARIAANELLAESYLAIDSGTSPYWSLRSHVLTMIDVINAAQSIHQDWPSKMEKVTK